MFVTRPIVLPNYSNSLSLSEEEEVLKKHVWRCYHLRLHWCEAWPQPRRAGTMVWAWPFLWLPWLRYHQFQKPTTPAENSRQKRYVPYQNQFYWQDPPITFLFFHVVLFFFFLIRDQDYLSTIVTNSFVIHVILVD